MWSGKITSPSVTSLVQITDSPAATSYTPVILNGTGQGLAVNFGGVALPPGLSVQVMFWWNEQ